MVYLYIGNIYVYTNPYLHVTIINLKRGHEFESYQGGVYGEDCREKREGAYDIIIASEIKEKHEKEVL